MECSKKCSSRSPPKNQSFHPFFSGPLYIYIYIYCLHLLLSFLLFDNCVLINKSPSISSRVMTCSARQTCPEHANGVSSCESAILVAAAKLLHDTTLNGTARAGKVALWTLDLAAILPAGQSVLFDTLSHEDA